MALHPHTRVLVRAVTVEVATLALVAVLLAAVLVAQATAMVVKVWAEVSNLLVKKAVQHMQKAAMIITLLITDHKIVTRRWPVPWLQLWECLSQASPSE